MPPWLGLVHQVRLSLRVVNSVKGIFGSSDCKKVLVVWDVQNNEVIGQAKARYVIEVWKISDAMNEMIKEVIATMVYGDRVV